MDELTFNMIFIIGAFVCGILVGYTIGVRKEDEPVMEIIDR